MFYQAKRSRRLAICRGTPMLLCTLLLASACSSGSAKAGLGPNENLAPSIVSLDLQVAQRVHGTDEAAVIRAKGRRSDGGQVNLPTDWEALDGGTVTPLGDGSIALFSSDDKGPKRIVGRGRGNGNGNGNGGSGSTPEPTDPIVDTVTVVVEEVTSPIAAISISPDPATVVRNTSQVFTATGFRADGSLATPNVTWSASGGGSISGAGAGAEYDAGSTVGEWSVQAVAESGVADVAKVNVTDAWVFEDFSRYESTLELITNDEKNTSPFNPDGIYSSFEDINRSRISLDRNVGHGGSGQSMRYDYPDRTADTSGRCHDFTIGRWLRLPEPVQEVWVEAWVRFSNGFATVAPISWNCTSNPELKFFMLAVHGQSGRFGLNAGTSAGQKFYVHPPDGAATDGTPSGLSPMLPNHDVFNDGAWHRYRIHAKVNTGGKNGIVEGWVDDERIISRTGLDVWAENIYGIMLGRNINQGPGHVQSLWWGSVKAWRTNPGW